MTTRIRSSNIFLYSRTFDVHSEELDGHNTVTVVFGSPLNRTRIKELDKTFLQALKTYFGPDSEIQVAK